MMSLKDVHIGKMRKEKRWRPVCIVSTSRHEEGYILYEQLLTLLIISCILPFISFILYFVQQVETYDDISVEHFFIFLRNDMWYARDYYTNQNKLYIINEDSSEAVIELANERIRRRLNGGTEFYLFDVKTFHVKELDYGIAITIETNNNHVYEKIIYMQ